MCTARRTTIHHNEYESILVQVISMQRVLYIFGILGVYIVHTQSKPPLHSHINKLGTCKGVPTVCGQFVGAFYKHQRSRLLHFRLSGSQIYGVQGTQGSVR